MKVTAIQSNSGIFSNNKFQKTSFCAVRMQPYPETLGVIMYNIGKRGKEALGEMTHHLEWSEKWDMDVWGYARRLHFEAWSKEKPKELVLDVLNINPLQKQSNDIDKEFEICAMTYNHKDATNSKKSFYLVFKDKDLAKQAYDTLSRNYQVFKETLRLKTRKSNLERIRIAEENFNILENSEIKNVINVN